MKLNVKALSVIGAILWGGCFFLVGVAHSIWSSYGTAWLQLGASIYPGYHGPGGFGSAIVVGLYAALDGAICGALVAWLYNVLAANPAGPV